MEKEFKDIMIDIETMGTRSYAAIISIAAVKFNLETGEIGETFYRAINLESAVLFGLHIEADTVNWWLSKSKEAQDIYLNSKKTDLDKALYLLSEFVEPDARVWGNAARFDLGLLINAYHKCNSKPKWSIKNEMCVRTLANLFPSIKTQHEYSGIAHDPVSDCLNQIQYTVKAYQIFSSISAK